MRKKIILTLWILTILSSVAHAQFKPFRFGFKVGPNLSWLAPDAEGYESNGISGGFSWGFVSDFAITENYFISTGFGMDYLGGKLEYPHSMKFDDDTVSYTGDLSRKYNLRYLEIPLTLKMRTNMFGRIAYYGKIGFGTSFNLKSKSKDEFSYFDNGAKITEDFEEDIKDDIVFFHESIIFGGGVEYFVDESTSINVGISFKNGLTNVLKGENSVDPDIEEKANLHYFQLNVGVIF